METVIESLRKLDVGALLVREAELCRELREVRVLIAAHRGVTISTQRGGRRRDLIAAAWLVERFRERREWSARELFAAAEVAGVSRNAVFEAKRLLGLPAARRGPAENGEAYYWSVPEDWTPLTDIITYPNTE